MQLKNVQDRVNKEKVWVMKFEKERIKTGQNLFGDLYTSATNLKANVIKPTLTSSPSQVVVSPIRPPGNTRQSAGRQVGFHSLWLIHTARDRERDRDLSLYRPVCMSHYTGYKEHPVRKSINFFAPAS